MGGIGEAGMEGGGARVGVGGGWWVGAAVVGACVGAGVATAVERQRCWRAREERHRVRLERAVKAVAVLRAKAHGDPSCLGVDPEVEQLWGSVVGAMAYGRFKIDAMASFGRGGKLDAVEESLRESLAKLVQDLRAQTRRRRGDGNGMGTAAVNGVDEGYGDAVSLGDGGGFSAPGGAGENSRNESALFRAWHEAKSKSTDEVPDDDLFLVGDDALRAFLQGEFASASGGYSGRAELRDRVQSYANLNTLAGVEEGEVSRLGAGAPTRCKANRHFRSIVIAVVCVGRLRRGSFSCSAPIEGFVSVKGPGKSKAEFGEIMSKLGTWEFDVLDVARYVHPSRVLSYVVVAIMRRRNLLARLRIVEDVFLRFIYGVDALYPAQNLYHHSRHAADVTATVDFMLEHGFAESCNLSDLDVFAALLAAVAHDLDHQGVNNAHLVTTGHALSLLYNDQSVQEMHHCATLFKLLQRPAMNVLMSMGKEERCKVREIVVSAILGTDMMKHSAKFKRFRDWRRLNVPYGVSGTPVSPVSKSRAVRRVSGSLIPENPDEVKLMLIEMLVHAADLSNPAKPLSIAAAWGLMVTDEFFRQGDIERDMGLMVPPLFDRHAESDEARVRGKAQAGFISFVVKPLFDEILPCMRPEVASPVRDGLERNEAFWTGVQNGTEDLRATLYALRPRDADTFFNEFCLIPGR